MRFLLCSLSSYGLLGPTIALARALQAGGHSVACVTDQSMQAPLQQAGIARIPRGPTDGRSFQIDLTGHPLDNARQVKHIEYALETFRPDVLVGQQMTIGALIAGRRHRLPTAVLGLSSYLWPSPSLSSITWFNERADYQNVSYPAYVTHRYENMWRSYTITCDMFWLELPANDPPTTPLNGDLLLLRSVPGLEGLSDLPPQVHFIGDCSWDFAQVAADPDWNDWIAQARASGRPIVYVQPGRVFDGPGFWHDLAVGLSDQPVWVAASIGRSDRTVDRLPQNFFVRDHLPYDLVLPYAAGVICSSTSTTVLAALRYGLPLLLVPGGGGGEQRDLSLRCIRAGVAHYCSPAEVNPSRMWACVQLLLKDRALMRHAQALQTELAQVGGTQRAVALLEQLASERRPIRQATSVMQM